MFMTMIRERTKWKKRRWKRKSYQKEEVKKEDKNDAVGIVGRK